MLYITQIEVRRRVIIQWIKFEFQFEENWKILPLRAVVVFCDVNYTYNIFKSSDWNEEERELRTLNNFNVEAVWKMKAVLELY